MLEMTRESGIRMDMKEGGEADANSNLVAVGAAAYLNDEQEKQSGEEQESPCHALPQTSPGVAGATPPAPHKNSSRFYLSELRGRGSEKPRTSRGAA